MNGPEPQLVNFNPSELLVIADRVVLCRQDWLYLISTRVTSGEKCNSRACPAARQINNYDLMNSLLLSKKLRVTIIL